MSLLEQFQHGRHYSALRDIVREGKALNQIARDASELELTALQHVAESAESSLLRSPVRIVGSPSGSRSSMSDSVPVKPP